MPYSREDVDHARRDTAVGHHGDSLRGGAVGERLLLEDDLRVAAEVAEVHASLDRALRERQIEVVRDRAHHRVRLAHHGEHGLAIAHVERGGDEPRPRERLEKLGQVVEAQIGEPDLAHLGVLEQIIRTRRTLQSRSEYEHPHRTYSPCLVVRQREM